MVATKDDKLIVRIAPGLKRRIESTAKKQGKNVSDFVRDILVLFLDKDQTQYLDALTRLQDLKFKQAVLHQMIHDFKNDPNENTKENSHLKKINKVSELMSDLTRVNHDIYEIETYIKEYLQSEEIK